MLRYRLLENAVPEPIPLASRMGRFLAVRGHLVGAAWRFCLLHLRRCHGRLFVSNPGFILVEVLVVRRVVRLRRFRYFLLECGNDLLLDKLAAGTIDGVGDVGVEFGSAFVIA